MSTLTVEDLASNIDDIIGSLGEDKIVNWDVVESTENELMKTFE
jgi:hypothetical protein